MERKKKRLRLAALLLAAALALGLTGCESLKEIGRASCRERV